MKSVANCPDNDLEQEQNDVDYLDQNLHVSQWTSILSTLISKMCTAEQIIYTEQKILQLHVQNIFKNLEILEIEVFVYQMSKQVDAYRRKSRDTVQIRYLDFPSVFFTLCGRSGGNLCNCSGPSGNQGPVSDLSMSTN